METFWTVFGIGLGVVAAGYVAITAGYLLMGFLVKRTFKSVDPRPFAERFEEYAERLAGKIVEAQERAKEKGDE